MFYFIPDIISFSVNNGAHTNPICESKIFIKLKSKFI